jgi:2-polyprenyl-3-methyl-5-hydroxy-6-metoxy-1,4-benzoquinol methylase
MSLPLELDDSLDAAEAHAFSLRAAEIVEHGAIAVMLAIGHRSGLFDTLAAMPPSTSAEIARRSELAERYVREWLACMTTGGIVRYEPRSRTYHLPETHAAALTRAGALGNMAVYAQFVALMGQVQDKVLACFETGDGLAYDDYPRFHEVMAEDSAQTVVAGLFDHVLPLVPGIAPRLESGIRVLDAGCGRGAALIALARRFRRSRFTGYELSGEAVATATATAAAAGLDNVTFAVRDLTHFDERERYDFVVSFDAIHDQKDPQDLLRRLFRAVRPGGTYLVQDIGGSAHLENNLEFPLASLLYAVSCMHCTPVSLGQGGAGLGTMWGWETAEAMLAAAGFEGVERHVLAHDPMNVWFVARRAA